MSTHGPLLMSCSGVNSRYRYLGRDPCSPEHHAHLRVSESRNDGMESVTAESSTCSSVANPHFTLDGRR